MNLLFEHEWFLYELHGWLCWKSSLTTALVSKTYWNMYHKHNTIITIDLSKRACWNKSRHSLFSDTDVVGIVVFPPKLSLGLEHAGHTRKKFRQRLEKYWLPYHPNLQFVEYRHHKKNNFVYNINLVDFVKVTDPSFQKFDFRHIFNRIKFYHSSSMWVKNSFTLMKKLTFKSLSEKYEEYLKHFDPTFFIDDRITNAMYQS